jgi:[ribosomal protein S5]-alanine N-acetyltransferase
MLTTERLNLRELREEDAEALFTLRSDDRVNRYIQRNVPATVEDVRNTIDKLNANIPKSECGYWALTLKGETELIGTSRLSVRAQSSATSCFPPFRKKA